MKILWPKIVFFLVFLNVLLSCFWLLNGNLIIQFDISRDLMIWYDIYFNKHLTLIGGHSGTINGVFHGPLWYYLNLPAIILGGGNPIFLGWFWVLLSIITLVIIYFVALKLFNKNAALLSILIFSFNSTVNAVDESKYFYNPYGAVMLTPLFFYLFYLYIKKPSIKILFAALFFLGLIIQFQIAFGIPVLLLTILFLSVFIIRKKLFKHLLAFTILLLPLSSFILFELRHSFIQTNTVLNFILYEQPPESGSLLKFLYSRFYSLFLDNFNMLIPGYFYLQILFSFLFFATFFYYLYKRKNFPVMLLFGYFYFGFLSVTFFFWEKIVNYYWPFLPLIVIFLSAFLTTLPKKISIPLIFALLAINIIHNTNVLSSYNPDPSSHSFESWDYNLRMAKTIFQDAEGDFGYFIFTPDLFGYSQRYAMEYTARQFPNKISHPFAKRKLTYLIMLNAPKDRPDLNPDLWKISEVKITKNPDKIFVYPDYKIEKYRLDGDELKIQANPNLLLINNLYFR